MENESGACCFACMSDSPFVESFAECMSFLKHREIVHTDRNKFCGNF
jgi:hypothetical protein